MAKQSPKRVEPVATLVLVVEYDEFPDVDEIQSLVETARGFGSIVRADLTVRRAVTKSLI